MLSSHFPSIVLQITSVSWRGALHMAAALIFMSDALVFAAAAQGIPLDCLALVAKGTFIPWSRFPYPGHCVNCKLRHNQSFCEGGIFACLRVYPRSSSELAHI